MIDDEMHDTPAESPNAKRSAAAVSRDDQGHRQIGPGTSPIDLAIAFREMALEGANREAACIENGLHTTDELKKIRAQLTLMGPSQGRYLALLVVVGVLAVTQVGVVFALVRVFEILHHLRP